MKSKTEFYKAFFEAIEKKGFSIRPPSSPDYVADLYYRDKPIAFYGKQDAIIKNPFVEVDEKLIDRLQSLARTTAIGCGRQGSGWSRCRTATLPPRFTPGIPCSAW